MAHSNLFNEPLNKSCKYDITCEKLTKHRCKGCGEAYCMNHYLEHQRKLQEHLKYVVYIQDLLNEKFELLLSHMSTNVISDLIRSICEFKTKLDEIVNTTNRIQHQLSDLIGQDLKNEFKYDQNDYLENDLVRLTKDIEKLELKLEEIDDDSKRRALQEQPYIDDTKVLSTTKSSMQSTVGNLSGSTTSEVNDTSKLSYQFLKRMNSLTLDLNENEFIPTELENKMNVEENEAIVTIDPNTRPEIKKKIHLANNIVLWLRGPLKSTVSGIMHGVDLFAQGTHIKDNVLQAVERRLTKQPQLTNNSNKPAFIKITSDWIPEGENSDKGFSSATNWIRDPQGRRLLLKTQELPLGAANEWFGYVLGTQLGLPVNEVQISIYENNLVTLHTDLTKEDEKTMTLLDVPREQRNKLMTHPIMESMDLFDHILQNVDRNLRNILLTVPKTSDINDENAPLKIRLIDHSSCFGMGKLNFISIFAQKFHSSHLSVVKFDPIHKAKQFEQYLNEIPVSDRVFVSETLNRFASTTDDQFDTWITEMQDLLSSSQYNRILSVLHRQRDIARRYIIQWGICPEFSVENLNETK